MAGLFSCTFQGETQFEGAVTAPSQEVARHAFPIAPPSTAPMDPAYRSYKTAPLPERRLLVAFTSSRGDRDKFGRPVLTARGCILESSELKGPFRDLAAIWTVLARDGVPTWGEFETDVLAESIQENRDAFHEVIRQLNAEGQFYASVAAALAAPPATIFVPDDADVAVLLRPALALLPRHSLLRLHFASGSAVADDHEPVIATTDAKTDDSRAGSRWWGGRSNAKIVDFKDRTVQGLSANALAAVATAVADPGAWPSLDMHERYEVILRCLDSLEMPGAPRSPFEIVAGLEETRRGIKRVEAFATAIKALEGAKL
jgi:hypothetical protein